MQLNLSKILSKRIGTEEYAQKSLDAVSLFSNVLLRKAINII